MNHHEDEYTDYSCSTPLERLARDLETTLRSWHVSFNDRHVSFQNSFGHSSSTNSSYPQSISVFDKSVRTSSTIGSGNKSKSRGGVQLIRSSEIVITTFEKETVHLSLSLWDAPSSSSSSSNSHGSKNSGKNSTSSSYLSSYTPKNQSSNVPSSPSPRLPMSLHPPSITSSNCLCDLSTLFGIGQHIVLTTSKTKELQTFSINVDMMQMSLNIATQNCHCRIPAFALPGEYEPLGWSHYDPGSITMTTTNSPPLFDIPAWLVPEHIVHCTKSDEWTTSAAEEWTSSLANSLNNSYTARNILANMRLVKKRNHVVSTALIPYDTENDSHHPKNKRHYYPSIFHGYCNPGSHFMDLGASFVLEYIPTYIPAHLQTVEDLACLLRYNCEEINDSMHSHLFGKDITTTTQDDIQLKYVSYKYEWNKRNILVRQATLQSYLDKVEFYDPSEWRIDIGDDIVCDMNDSFVSQCTEHALFLLRSAHQYGKSISDETSEPIWGPTLDPLSSVQVSLSWLDPPKPSQSVASAAVSALSTFSPIGKPSSCSETTTTHPLNDHHRQQLYQPPLFSPIQTPPLSFKTKCFWDRTIPCHTLSASTRCTLAAFLRANTLHRDFLLCQLSNMTVLKELRKQSSQRDVINKDEEEDEADMDMNEQAMTLSDLSLKNMVTKKLVKAMDLRDSVDLPSQEELEDRLESIFDGKNFPSRDDRKIAAFLDRDYDYCEDEEEEEEEQEHSGLHRAAPPGRLMSLLCMHMAQMQTPARMAALWLAFVDKLRLRWEMRETLPLLNPIDGFDKMVDVIKNNVTNSTVKGEKGANFAAFNHYSEPDPNHNFCLINQKLQVFNIGVETQIAADKVWIQYQEKMREEEEKQRQKKLDRSQQDMLDEDDNIPPSACYASTTTISDTPIPDMPSPIYGNEIHESSADLDDIHGITSSGDSVEEFFDTVDNADDKDDTLDDDLFQTPTKSKPVSDLLVSMTPSSQHSIEESINVVQRQQRRGARCPVNRVNLIASGDQLFAPYLQRPLPLTEDVLVQRESMMLRQGSSVKNRLMIAQRWQKPKLLSDMKAFKAANPGAIFQDFIYWYGNPDGPHDTIFTNDCDFNDIMSLVTARTSPPSAGKSSMKRVTSSGSIEEVNDACEVLTSTRTFWSDTWDEAEPKPASEQQPPLFDPLKEVEMVLNYFDTIHPSHLLNQILAVNFVNAYFILRAAAEDTMNVKTVRFALERLEDRTRNALDKLDQCLLINTLFADKLAEQANKNLLCETLSACEAVCESIGDVEVILARATSLLHKFSGDFELVQNILRKRDGEELPIQSFHGRLGVLKTIWKHQKPRSSKDDKIWKSSIPSKGIGYYPDPMVEEYILRNVREDCPFQLSAVMRENITNFSKPRKGYSKDGSILIAMKKCEGE